MRENINPYDVTKKIVRFDDYMRRQLMVSKESRYNLGPNRSEIPSASQPAPGELTLLQKVTSIFQSISQIFVSMSIVTYMQ